MGAPTDREMFRAMARECVAFRAQRAARIITRIYDQHLAMLGLTSTQLTLLSAIANRPDHNSQELAELIGAEPSSVSRGIALLVKKKWVKQISSERDKRERLYALTDSGLDIARKAFVRWEEAQEDVRVALGAAGLADLTRNLDRVAAIKPLDAP
jgi:DNA-binding MarR family transcriptional regulator